MMILCVGKKKTTILYHNQTFNTVNDKIKG